MWGLFPCSVGSIPIKPRPYARVSLRAYALVSLCACLLHNVLLLRLRVCALLPRDGVAVGEAAIERAIVPRGSNRSYLSACRARAKIPKLTMCMFTGGAGGIPNLAKMRKRAANGTASVARAAAAVATASALAPSTCAPPSSVVSTVGAGGAHGASARSSAGLLDVHPRGGYVVLVSVWLSAIENTLYRRFALACCYREHILSLFRSRVLRGQS